MDRAPTAVVVNLKGSIQVVEDQFSENNLFYSFVIRKRLNNFVHLHRQGLRFYRIALCSFALAGAFLLPLQSFQADGGPSAKKHPLPAVNFSAPVGYFEAPFSL